MLGYVFAFMILFLPANIGVDAPLPTRPLALQACQKAYPNGKVILNESLIVLAPYTGTQVTTSFVWQCYRPVTTLELSKGEK